MEFKVDERLCIYLQQLFSLIEKFEHHKIEKVSLMTARLIDDTLMAFTATLKLLVGKLI